MCMIIQQKRSNVKALSQIKLLDISENLAYTSHKVCDMRFGALDRPYVLRIKISCGGWRCRYEDKGKNLRSDENVRGTDAE